MSSINSRVPCINCNNRSTSNISCHSLCLAYKSWREEYDEVKKLIETNKKRFYISYNKRITDFQR
jgi:hypothetical protein